MNNIVSLSFLVMCLLSNSCTSTDKNEKTNQPMSVISDSTKRLDTTEIIKNENKEDENDTVVFEDMRTIAENSGNAIVKVKKELNQTIDSIKEIYEGRDVFLGYFEKSQMVWEEYLEAQSLMANPPSSGGSAYTDRICWNYYRMGFIEQRIKVLKKWLKGGTQGDICNGTVKLFYDGEYHPAPGDTSEYYLY
ncbi:hypothetical protein N9K26_01335 [Flavobacteriales bacterium]|nr:hypothetical protein [Flavobacteriales bacterium]